MIFEKQIDDNNERWSGLGPIPVLFNINGKNNVYQLSLKIYIDR